MFFLNFGLLQFAMAAGLASLATVALYLLDRSRRRQVVSTLRFWTEARQPVQTARRRHIQQPWSLVLQLLGTLLLLLAMAQPRAGNPFAKPNDHVLVLETSAWMGARSGGGTLMDAARRRALDWLASVPAGDRVMLIRANAVATPATAFETDHRRVEAAIVDSTAGATALDIGEALTAAKRARDLQGGGGETVFAGTGRVKETTENAGVPSDGLRVLLVPDAIANTGIRGVSAKRSATDPTEWTALVGVRNYGTRARTVTLSAGFNQAPVGAHHVTLPPGAEQAETFTWHAQTAGIFELQLTPDDGFSDDNRATLQLAAAPLLRTVVYTTRAEALRPLFAANPRVEAQFRNPSQYRADGAGLVILDKFVPPTPPRGDSIWIDPPAAGSPIASIRTVAKPAGLRWSSNALGAGLHQHDTKLDSASILQPATKDLVVAQVDAGPVIVARPGTKKTVVIGFDPERAGTRYELSTPLAFANILRWIEPEAFRQAEVSVRAAGSVTVPVVESATENSGTPAVTREADGTAIPFTAEHGAVRFFTGSRDNVVVRTPGRETTYSLTLPELGTAKWEPPPGAVRGVKRGVLGVRSRPELWPWLAVAGALCFVAEWMWFARARRAQLQPMPGRPALRRAS